MPDQVRHSEARKILSPVTGFLREAGFTHSLTPARNCMFGCTYCYVPTMRIYAGLQHDDWERWGQFTTFKSNTAALLERELRPDQRIYCSPLVDPYQPPEAGERIMPAILRQVLASRPRIFVLQTRGPLILRDLDLLQGLGSTLRVSFSLTTNREEVQRLYEPLCAPYPERLAVIRILRDAGIAVYATLAPLLPCDPERLVQDAIEATGRGLVGDPLHVRATKSQGATTRGAAFRIAQVHHHEAWFDPAFQQELVDRITAAAEERGYGFSTGPRGFSILAA